MTKWRVVISEPAYAQHDAPGKVVAEKVCTALDPAMAAVISMIEYQRVYDYTIGLRRGLEISVHPV